MRRQGLNKARGLIRLKYQLNNYGEQSCTYYQQEPLRILFPKMPYIAVPVAVLINTSGGIAGGDHHSITLGTAKGTKAFVTTQAAEKIYYSPGMYTRINTHIETAKDSWLEWAPQETIIFNGARFRRRTNFSVLPGSEIMAGEILILGRTGRGETFERGFLHDQWSVSWDNTLIWQDALYLQENATLDALKNPAGFNGAISYGTFIYVSAKAPAQLEVAKEFLRACKTKSYAISFNNLIVIRWLSANSLQLRQDFISFWGFWRNKMADLPNIVPTFWHF